ncbi:MAG: HlyD family efflux transporter periplasmic adaptor subunit [Ignavibacteriae bacterium]|nr:HlyD family efflux transporter periplasmic adaptor subunit [Ignavibacteriota bacterium]
MDKKLQKKKWTLKKVLGISWIAFFMVFIFYNIFFGDHSSKLNVDKERTTISTVRYEPFQEFIPITGTIQPIKTFFLDVTEGGRVVKKFIEEGSFVEAGDPILKLENAQMTLSLMYNEAQLFQQINSLRGTRLAMEQNKLSLQAQILDLEYQILKQKRIYYTNKKLFEKNLIAKLEFQQMKDQYNFLLKRKSLTTETVKKDSLFRLQQINQLEFSVKQMKKNLNVTKRQLENLTVKAPIKGQLTSLKAEIGESISPGENLGQIDAVDSFKVSAEVDEHYIARINIGQKGEFTLSGITYTVIIKTVFPEVKNGRFEVDMVFTGQAPEGLRRGQTLHIKLELGELLESLIVARGGFYQTTGGQWIFVLDESEQTATKRNIKLGRQNTQVFEVIEGLVKGEKVITSSYDSFGDVEKIVLK